jgi:large subunit ribosomal protein L22
MNITAKLNDYRQSPRKVRLVAAVIRGQKVERAEGILMTTVKRASDPIMSLLNSAVANAKNNFSLAKEDLFVKSLTVDNGAILYRRMPRARGVAYAIRKRTSHVTLVLGVTGEVEVKETKKEVKEVKAVKAPKAKAIKAPKLKK